MELDEDYFLKKFEAIPEEEWCSGDFEVIEEGDMGKPDLVMHCAFGHVGIRAGDVDEYYENREASALRKIGDVHSKRVGMDIIQANDYEYTHHQDDPNGPSRMVPGNRYGNNPRTRVLNYLKEAKEARLKEELLAEVNNIINTKIEVLCIQ